jgi:DNA mismatch repair protein MutL
MGKIKKLTTELINLIAAGEVVERPASVIKELLENSIDAGATKIAVNIEEFGTKLIEVVDNGSGMDSEDALTAFIQHATSKINSKEDLEKIRSFGFRGEALASIAQVSEETTIETQQSVSPKGSISKFRSGETTLTESYVKEQGTSVRVTNLFKNYPARLKFLKSSATENKYIEQIFKEIALVNKDIEFELNVDGKQEYKLPAVKQRVERIYDIWGKDTASSFYQEEHYDGSQMKADILISKPELAKKGTPLQLVYVNNRPINNKTIHAAIIQGYEGSIHRELKPNYVVMLNIDPELVDVNIHPRKMEVKFNNDQEVFRLIYSFTKKTLEKNSRKSMFGDVESTETRAENSSSEGRSTTTDSLSDLSFTMPSNYNPIKSFSSGIKNTTPKISSKDEAINFTKLLTDSVKDMNQGVEHSPAEEQFIFKPLQLFNTYIVFEKSNEVYIVDQHAAAEKVLFEKLVREYTSEGSRSKPLLVPEIIELRKHEKERVLANIEVLNSIGIVADDFGGNSIRISEIPALLRDFDTNGYIREMIEEHEELVPLRSFNNDFDLTEDEYYLLATAACHGSIRAGQRLSEMEMVSLLKSIDLIDTTQNCPHGRPIVTILTRSEIEKGFKRII